MNGYKVVTTAEQGSQEWLEVRRNGIGGSDVSAVLGVNPFKTAIEVYLDKTGQGDGFTGNTRTEWGSRLEPVVRDHYAEQHPGWWVDEVPGVLAHPDLPCAQASLDGLVNNKAGQRILEIKCTAQTWDCPPDYYLMQVLWYMAVTGVPVADFAVLTRGNDYREFTVERDQTVVDYMLEEVDDWWYAHCDPNGPRTMPEVDVVRDRDILSRLWTPDVTLEPVVLDVELIARLRDTKAAANAAQTAYAVAAAEVQAVMQERVAAVDAAGDKVASWTPTKPRTTVDTARLKADGLYDTYSMTGQPGRSFRAAL